MPVDAHSTHKSRAFSLILAGITAIVASVVGAILGWGVQRYVIRSMPSARHNSLPQIVFADGAIEVKMANGNLLAEVGTYSSELTAYLRFEYLRGLTALSGTPILMTSKEEGGSPSYRLYAALPNKVLAASHRLGQLQTDGFIESYSLASPPAEQLRDWFKQTQLFEAAYTGPVRKRLSQLPEGLLTSEVARFILFKVKTDQRVSRQLVPVEKVVSPEQSLRFAADMIAVSRFYKIPLDLLLGIGAMENNYLDVRGDLHHTVWKRRAQPGDIVLERRGGRVLVRNYSIGPWQITRETLRYAHALYLKDHRDYSQLPQRLRPPRRLNLNHVNSDVLTTYAGLLLKNLLEKFHGNVAKAAGAYNGGAGDPNLKYAEGVAMVADYAHRVLAMTTERKMDAIEATALKVKSSP